MIGPGIKINGDISGDEDLVIKGQVDGKVDLGSNEVEIDQSGHVTADVSAKVVKIAGKVRGDIDGSEKVIISKSGNVKGNIVAPRVTLEDGAKFKGSIDMDPGDSVASELPLSAGKKADNVKSISDDTASKETGLGLNGG